jgi:hypothetical protein
MLCVPSAQLLRLQLLQLLVLLRQHVLHAAADQADDTVAFGTRVL